MADGGWGMGDGGWGQTDQGTATELLLNRLRSLSHIRHLTVVLPLRALELGQTLTGLLHVRLQVRIRVLPELDEPRVVGHGLLAVALCVIELRQALVAARECTAGLRGTGE